SMRLIKEGGFGWIRQQFSWTAVEPSAKGKSIDTSRGVSNWERYDEIMRAAQEEGIQVLARIDLPPEWARPPGSYKTHPPLDTRDYGDFVQSFLERYRGQVRYIQLWNEPNLNEEWGRRPVDPAGYVELLKAGADGARRADPGVRIVTAALAQTLEPDDPSASGLDDLLYLDRLYMHGAKPHFDVLAVNAYGLWTGPDDRRTAPAHANFPRVLLTRDVMLRHQDGGKAVWIAEFGWNALPPGWQGEPSPWGSVEPVRQASYILGSYERAQTEWPWMGPMALWLFRKPGADARDPTPFFALVDDAWQPRPAYEALKRTADLRPLGTGVQQESFPELRYQGLWQWTPDVTASQGEMRESPISGASVRWRFRGTQVDLIAPRGPSRGAAFVKVNGAYTLANRLPLNQNGQATIDFYAPEVMPRQRITIASGLPDRVHEVELTVTGARAVASSGVGIGLDAVAVSRSRPIWPLVTLGGAWGGTLLILLWSLRSRVPLAIARFWLFQPDWPRFAALGTVALLPLTPVPIRTPVGTYTPVELCAVVAILTWMIRLYLGLATPRRGAFGVPAALFLAAGVLSTAVADYPRLALRELRTLVVEPALFYVVARSVLRGPRDAVALGGVYVTAATAAGALALFQTLTGQGLVVAEGVERAAALFRSPNNLGLLLGRALPLAAASALYLWRPLSLYFWFAGVLCAAALFFTFSRGAWLAAAAGLLLVGWPVATRWLRRVGRLQLTLAAAGLVGLVVIGVAAGAQVDRFRSLFSAAGTGFLRFHLWGASIGM
ncbi:MAG TPA: hypothetical protein VNM48_16145, partial [Chloroflexota bacterium]|nr:hypothetical protein [Chloroflexota bacterium]